MASQQHMLMLLANEVIRDVCFLALSCDTKFIITKYCSFIFVYFVEYVIISYFYDMDQCSDT